MIKLLCLLMIITLVGCGETPEDHLQSHINKFTQQCEQLSQCLGKHTKVSIDIKANTPLICEVKYDDDTTSNISIPYGTDIYTEPPAFGYLSDAIAVCEILQKKGDYSDEQQRLYSKHSNCLKNPEESRESCWEKYKNGKL